MSEEFGGVGGQAYARYAATSGEKHVAALESDRGGFAPVGFSVPNDDVAATLTAWEDYLRPVQATELTIGEGGTDIDPLAAQGVATFGFVPESAHYFDLHHSALDRLEAVKPAELHAGAAAMAVLTYLLAEVGLP